MPCGVVDGVFTSRIDLSGPFVSTALPAVLSSHEERPTQARQEWAGRLVISPIWYALLESRSVPSAQVQSNKRMLNRRGGIAGYSHDDRMEIGRTNAAAEHNLDVHAFTILSELLA